MIGELVIGTAAVTAGGLTYARQRRSRLYRELEAQIAGATRAQTLELQPLLGRELPSFADNLAVVTDLLPAEVFADIKLEAERLVAPERSFVPTHKKGGTVAYETLIASAPAIVAFYHSADFQNFISRVVGARVQPTPIHDQSSLSLLFYTEPGDHIGWHFDHNFYRGRHFTILIALVNEGRAPGGLSHAQLAVRPGEQEMAVSTAPNTCVIFEGARVRHKVTPIHARERRLMLSMTYCADPRAYWWQGISRRFKDTAFYGVRALWT
jgi:hypothetical protein